mmetsp:Transcript_362/g.39  ORF Transcript_362/g.39 Transcript_362/m.39 type:complete len:92 (-) Transcript_362:104-379(-)|eukprot:CAMPEP_0204821176 /NCGR_PEP_ID=MMETSP1018-20131115/4209_1 /ASSEMBLY_ACC=CAM_ASM_000518 /TAXON_ID=46462 /ORGANISM="Anophryoides haemophila, Strain AH6" /LENGTH=91 /DNA_ID=CAMNT_0051921649 /DNA_START=137 /DNA_END=412 /DNA_ORIENTATION=-
MSPISKSPCSSSTGAASSATAAAGAAPPATAAGAAADPAVGTNKSATFLPERDLANNPGQKDSILTLAALIKVAIYLAFTSKPSSCKIKVA